MNTAGQPPVKWNLRRASVKFLVSIPTLVSRLNAADKTFTTKQIVEELYGDVHQERLGKLNAEREQIELENLAFKREWLPRAELARVFDEIAAETLVILKSSKLSRTEQEYLQKQLAGIPVRIKDLAKPERSAQTTNGNGAKPRRRSSDPAQEQERGVRKGSVNNS